MLLLHFHKALQCIMVYSQLSYYGRILEWHPDHDPCFDHSLIAVVMSNSNEVKAMKRVE